VRRTGQVAPGAARVLQERPHPEWTILHVNRVSYDLDGGTDERDLRALADLPALAAAWREGILGV
jgi:MOSC domain-containing protein YiiM